MKTRFRDPEITSDMGDRRITTTSDLDHVPAKLFRIRLQHSDSFLQGTILTDQQSTELGADPHARQSPLPVQHPCRTAKKSLSNAGTEPHGHLITIVTVNEHGAFTAEITAETAGTFQFRARYISNGEWSDYATATSATATATVRAR
ncbi:MAG: hypothetical protein WA988_02430 [Candidatus Nanopelagicales bacterium]